jgi:hypothetical protein
MPHGYGFTLYKECAHPVLSLAVGDGYSAMLAEMFGMRYAYWAFH